jgi:hypothetical protein
MIAKQLEWNIQATHPKIWIAQINEYALVQFMIYHIKEEEYLLTSNLTGIKDLIIKELDFTKQMAQYQLEAFINSLTQSNSND